MKLISKPILIREDDNKIMNIEMNSSLKRILNTDLLGKIIKIYIKDKEIKNKSIKSEILKIFKLIKRNNKIINNNVVTLKSTIKNWYDIINIKEIKSEINCIIIRIKGRINTRVGASRTKTYLYKSNTKQEKGEESVLKLRLKNGSIGIKIRIDSTVTT